MKKFVFEYNEVCRGTIEVFAFDEDEAREKAEEEEILNSIIKSTLSYSLNLINIHTLENKLMKVLYHLVNLTLYVLFQFYLTTHHNFYK